MKQIIFFLMFLHILCTADAQGEKSLQVAVFCSGDNNIALHLKEVAYGLGQYLGSNQFGLMTGGGNTGLMKEVADGYVSTAISLERFRGIILQKYASQPNDCHPALSNETIELVETLHQRLNYFQSSADLFIVLPGGLGTLHELVDCLTHNKHMQKPIILLNIDGCWNGIIQQYEAIIISNPAVAKALTNFVVVDTSAACIEYLDIYRSIV